MNQGWIKLHRSLLEWEWFDDHNTTRLLLYLLLSVNYEDKKWKGETVKAGTLITSWENLSKGCGLSVKQTRTAMSKLEQAEEVTRKTASKWQAVTLVKWGKLQFDKPKEGRQRAGKGQQLKKERNKKPNKLFNMFWDKYPKKVGKTKSIESWYKLTTTDHNDILENLDAYIRYKPFKEYTHPNPTTFLNQRRWEDEDYKQIKTRANVTDRSF